MSETENVSVVRKAFEAFGSADVPAFMELLAEDVEWLIAGPSTVPYAGQRHGREGVLQFLQAIGAAVEFERFEPREFVAQGERVLAVGFERGRVRASGRTFDNPWILDFTIRDGRIARMHSYEDTYAVARAFGD